MKTLSLLILISFFSLNTYSQTVDVLNEILGAPLRMIDNGSDLYYCLNDLGEIRKIDVSIDSPSPVIVATGLVEPASMIIKDSVLYVAQFGAGRISKIDLSSSSTLVEDALVGLTNPNGLAIHNDTLYYSESIDSTVSKFDITSASPEPILVASHLDFPTTLAIRGNELFIAESLGNRISKISLGSTSQNVESVLTELDRPVGIRIKGDTLYVAELFSNNVLKLDITDVNSSPLNISAGFNSPSDVIFINNSDLYFLENSFAIGRISKIENYLTILDESNFNRITLYPNPTSGDLHFMNVEQSTTYKIFDIQGGMISKGNITQNGKVDLSSFPSGTYLIRLKSGVFQLIIKE